MWEIVRYSSEYKDQWDKCVARAKNATFLFYRDYMDYHSHRFDDFSLIFVRNGRIEALLPGNRAGDVLYSHQGLTYGGLIMTPKVKGTDVITFFKELNLYLSANGITRVVYKKMPWIYSVIPAEEDLYALWRVCGAQVQGRNLSTTIRISDDMEWEESRMCGLRKARSCGLEVVESDDFESFWNILTANLNARYHVVPVHSLDEIKLLHSRFPDNIRLYLAKKGDVVMGGIVVYLAYPVVHTQYISATPEGKKCGAVDAIVHYLLTQAFREYEYLDFGQSTERQGEVLNESLLFQKEGFGGRAVCYDIYSYSVSGI